MNNLIIKFAGTFFFTLPVICDSSFSKSRFPAAQKRVVVSLKKVQHKYNQNSIKTVVHHEPKMFVNFGEISDKFCASSSFSEDTHSSRHIYETFEQCRSNLLTIYTKPCI